MVIADLLLLQINDVDKVQGPIGKAQDRLYRQIYLHLAPPQS